MTEISLSVQEEEGEQYRRFDITNVPAAIFDSMADLISRMTGLHARRIKDQDIAKHAFTNDLVICSAIVDSIENWKPSELSKIKKTMGFEGWKKSIRMKEAEYELRDKWFQKIKRSTISDTDAFSASLAMEIDILKSMTDIKQVHRFAEVMEKTLAQVPFKQEGRGK